MTPPVGSRDHGHSQPEIDARLDAAGSTLRLRDAVYGGIDGAVTTFAIVAGAAGAGLSREVVLALGAANLFADAFSMAAGCREGALAERERLATLEALERRHLAEHPEGELRELRSILRRRGVEDDRLDVAVEAISASEALWIELMLRDEHGVSTVDPAPWRAALTTFAAFVIAGSVPLLPFALIESADFTAALAVAAVATAFTFLAIGALKARVSGAAALGSAIGTLGIGASAAAIAWGVGLLVDRLTG